MKHKAKEKKNHTWQVPDEVLPEETALYVPRKTSRNGAVVFNIAVFLVACMIVILGSYLLFGCVTSITLIIMLVVSAAAVNSFHIALAWERVVVLRLGKVNRIVGPGLYVTIPIIEHGTIRVDQRVIATPFGAEKTLTADLVPGRHRCCPLLDCSRCRRSLHGGRRLLHGGHASGPDGDEGSGGALLVGRGCNKARPA